MKKIFVLTMICLALSLTGLAQKGLAQKGKPGGPGNCALTGIPAVDVNASLFVNAGTNFSPDPGGPLYVTGGKGNNKISIVFQNGNCSHDLIVQLNGSTRYIGASIPGKGTFNAKFANFDRIYSVPVTTNTAAMNDFCGTNPDGSFRYDNYGGCGSDAGGAYVRRSVGFDLGDNTHNLRFQYSPISNPNGNPNVAGTAYIKVYHPTSNRWDLMPESPEVGVFLTNGNPEGNPIVPFWFTVTRQ